MTAVPILPDEEVGEEVGKVGVIKYKSNICGQREGGYAILILSSNRRRCPSSDNSIRLTTGPIRA